MPAVTLLALLLLLARMQRTVPPGNVKMKQQKEKEKTEELVALGDGV